LGSLHVPHAVTGEQNEIGIRGDRHRLHVWEGGDCLLLMWQALVCFVFEVAEGARESENAVDAAVFDEATGFLNSTQLFFVVGLVIDGKGQSCAVFRKDRARVTCIGAEDLVWGDENNGGGAACVTFVVHKVAWGGGLLNFGQLALTSL